MNVLKRKEFKRNCEAARRQRKREQKKTINNVNEIKNHSLTPNHSASVTSIRVYECSKIDNYFAFKLDKLLNNNNLQLIPVPGRGDCHIHSV